MERDYEVYCFSKTERLRYIVTYLTICLGVSWLFYHSFWAAVLFFPGVWLFLKGQKRKLVRFQKEALLNQFLTGLRAISSALNAGYSVENAVGEALKETEKVYGENGLFTEELREMERKLSLNQTLETLWADLGDRSHLEDLENFGEIFAVARRSGGDLNEIIHNTVENITRKAEAQREIEVSLAAKKMEQKIMSVVPFGILAYVDLGDPEFLEALYHNAFGITVMTVCLGVYILAFVWGRRIVEIEV